MHGAEEPVASRGKDLAQRLVEAFGVGAVVSLLIEVLALLAHGRMPGSLAAFGEPTAVLVAFVAPLAAALVMAHAVLERLLASAPRWATDTALAFGVGLVVAAPVRGFVPGSVARAFLPSAAFAVAVVAVGVMAAGLVLRRILAGAHRAVRVVVLGTLGSAVLVADGRVLVGTYGSLHFAAEVAGAVLLVAAVRSAVVAGAARTRATTTAVGVVALGWMGFFFTVPDVREQRVDALARFAQDPSPLGRLYRRVALPAIPSSRPDEEDGWGNGEDEPDEEAAAVAALRGACMDCNILVYFVDTLRADTANDPEVMPNVAAFARDALHFRNAYSTASDTLQVLPTLLAGRYDQKGSRSILDHVRERGIDNALFASESAHRFVSSQIPSFRFDEVTTIPDSAAGAEVWGYGADTPTGTAVGDRFLAWARAREGRRFFAWIYNFDLHAWRQLRDEHVPESARHLAPDAHPDARYAAVAKLVDESFGAVVDGLRAAGIAERTIVVLVSDHGEALGYRGLSTHSSFLWQPLVRVPVVLRVPTLDARIVDRDVSLVDVAPTLVRFLDTSIPARDFHGMDLLRFHVAPETPRALPILMRASSEGRPSYLGLVTPARKLVVPARGGRPQLHDLGVDDPDATDLAAREPEEVASLVRRLLRSPLTRAD